MARLRLKWEVKKFKEENLFRRKIGMGRVCLQGVVFRGIKNRGAEA